MSDFGTMIARIKRETRRTRLDTAIRDAIASAIQLEEIHTFYFMQGRATTVTAGSKAYYRLPSDFQDMRTLKATVNGSSYPVTKLTFEEIDEVDTGVSNEGYPEFYALWNKQLRLYPVPSGAFPLMLAYTKAQPALVEDDDSNDWMTDGEILIRQRAKEILFRDVIRGKEGAEGAAIAGSAAERAKERLRAETRKRTSTGKLRPSGYSGRLRA